MDELLKAIFARMDADAELGTMVASVYRYRNPESPKGITEPHVVFRVVRLPDSIGLHGAATEPHIEVKVWGYGDNMKPVCDRVAQRLDELMLARFTLSNGSVTLRFAADSGWGDIDDTDPEIIHMQNVYRTRFWDAKRIAILS